MATPSTPTGIIVVHTLQEMTKFRISWTANDASENVNTYNVYRGAVPYGTFDKVGSVVGGIVTYDDLAPLTFRLNWYYKISSVSGGSESSLSSASSIENFTFAPISLTGTEYYSDEDTEFMLEEIRDRLLSIMEYGGENVYVYKRMYSAEGEEEEPGRQKASYWDPLEIKYKFQPAGQVRQLEVAGLKTISTPRSWAIYYPLLHDRDVIVTRQNERFELVNVTHRRFRGWLIRQEFDVQKLDRFAFSDSLTPSSPLSP